MRAYFDHLATTPLHPDVLKAMLPFLSEKFGNPNSFHAWGEEPAEAVARARESVARLVNAKPEEIVFTSSGSEANNLAIKGTMWAKKGGVVLSPIEHYSVLNCLKFLEKRGVERVEVKVDQYGRVSAQEVADACDGARLVTVNHSNLEVGTLEPIAEIAELLPEEVIFHSDAVQSVGWVPVDVQKLGVDLLSMSAHRFYGPKGVGALFVRSGTQLVPLIHGGVQESGKRGGTENVAGIVGMGVAAEIAMRELDKRQKLTTLRDRLTEGLLELPDTKLNGAKERLPTHCNVSFRAVEGESVLALLNTEGIAAASGSACQSHALKVSYVLSAMGLEPEMAQGSILFSLGTENTKEEVDYVLNVIKPMIERLRKMSPLR